MKLKTGYGEEFEVTEADKALAHPLGTGGEPPEDLRTRSLAFELQQALKFTNLARTLPLGHWDAFIDEGDSQCAVPDCEDGQMCCNGDHHLLTRGSRPEYDDVFVRLAAVDDTTQVWDIEVFTRNTRDGVPLEQAYAAINGEEITTENLLRDLGALLAVFALYDRQGRFDQ